MPKLYSIKPLVWTHSLDWSSINWYATTCLGTLEIEECNRPRTEHGPRVKTFVTKERFDQIDDELESSNHRYWDTMEEARKHLEDLYHKRLLEDLVPHESNVGVVQQDTSNPG